MCEIEKTGITYPTINEVNCGPDCGNICDIIYYKMCAQCLCENECHKKHIDHYKMLDCTLNCITITGNFDKNYRKVE